MIDPSQNRRASTFFSLSGVAAVGLGLVLVVFGGDHGPFEPEPAPKNVVTITAKGLDFEAPDELPQGWTTFEFRNESGMTHFALLERLPEGIGVDEHQREVAPLFQEGFERMAAGEDEAASETFGQLPGWFAEVDFLGGPGLVGPGQTARATVRLEPGTYLLECYVKTNGLFHSYNPLSGADGMVHELSVTEETNRASAPTPSLDLSISAERGIERVDDGSLTPGTHVVSVHFEDRAVYEHFVGHDVHLARLEADTDLETVAAWMDWRRPEGLETPAPVSFVGGTNEVPAGDTAYFTVDLTPGRYAWIAEVPTPADKGMLVPFTVPSEEDITDRDGN